jgi:hypothetical protein
MKGRWNPESEGTRLYTSAGGVRARARHLSSHLGLQSVHLNVVGWAALLLPAVLVGTGAAAITGSVPIGVAAAASILAGYWTLDRRRHRASEAHFGFGDEQVTRLVAARLAEQGVRTSVEPGIPYDDEPAPRWELAYRMRDHRKVERAVEALAR